MPDFLVTNQVKSFNQFPAKQGFPFFCGFFPAPYYEHHTHKDFYEFALIAGGSFVHFYEGKETELHVGDLLYVCPGTYHALHGVDEDSMHYVFVVQKDWFLTILEKQNVDAELFLKTPLLRRIISHQQSNYISYLAGAIAGRVVPDNGLQIAEQLLATLLFAFGQEINAQSHFGVHRYVNHLIWKLDTYQLLCEHITDIYEGVPMSQTALINCFKRITGKTIVEYRHDKRMEYAAHLLLADNYQVAVVANLVGISCLSYFSALFKERYGMTPKQYQLAHRRKDKDIDK